MTVPYRPTASAPGVHLTVEDSLGRTVQSTGSGTAAQHDETVTLTTDGGRTDNFPLDVTAAVDGGQCRTATIADSSEPVTLGDGDWTAC